MGSTEEERAARAAALRAAGFDDEDVARWQLTLPQGTSDLATDRERFSRCWRIADELLRRLPSKPERDEAQSRAADVLQRSARETRRRFLGAHAAAVYALLTQGHSRFVRVEDLCYAAAELVPGLVPTRAQVAAEAKLVQRDKDGVEIDQGVFVSSVLAHPECGTHLCHAMLLPAPGAQEHAAEFAKRGALDLGQATLERRGKSVVFTMKNPRYLNAEDQTTIEAWERAVDVATLDAASEVAVLRGGPLDHPKYAGRRVFGTGINLTHLYHGRVPFLWFMTRELGFVNKFYRGVARPDLPPDDTTGETIEKPWIAAVEAFAIGGHCQYLLTMDYVIATSDAYMTLPARKEGIIPGAANLRLPRFVGDRIARQAVQYERRIDCDGPEGRMICDEVVPSARMDAAIDTVVERLTSSGVVSAASNRRAFRVTQEPLDDFRRYCAVYAREQAYCHYSPALVANLERFWNAQQRKPD